MIEGKRILAVIPARGGSKSIPQKNIAKFNGKPLIAWTIELANTIEEIDKVIVSTDDKEIANVAKEYGADVIKRPKELATDDALVIQAIQHTIDELENQSDVYDYLILLEATCPLRNALDIKDCINLTKNDVYDSIATFKEADLNPTRAWKIENHEPKTFIEGAIPWLPRQKLPSAYQLNGAVYISKVKNIKHSKREILTGNIGAVIMPKQRSIDIDDQVDFLLAEMVMQKLNIK